MAASSASSALEDATTNARFADQRERIVQILKDWKNPYSAGRPEYEEPLMYVENRALVGGNWPLNKEVTRRWADNPIAESHRIVGRELYSLAAYYPLLFCALQEVFLHDAAGDSDYEQLQKAAAAYPSAAGRAQKLLAAVEEAIDLLTQRLIDQELYAVFGERIIRKTHRRQSMEENYKEMYRIFESWCAELGKKYKRYRKMAYHNTAVQCEVSERTVMRAVHYVESGADGSS